MRQRIPARARDGERGSPTSSRGSRPKPPKRKRLEREGGAAAVEFALIVPVLVIFVFGIIGFGVAFMQMQTIRGALREGGRAAATGASADEVQDHAFRSALGAIDSARNVRVNPSTGRDPVCNAQSIGDDTTISYDTRNLPGGGIQVTIPFVPILLTPTLEANFRCEV
jgi:Flp pilus assembly protein TadG